MIKTHTVTIDGKEYEVDVEKAVKEGFLREIANYPLMVGDVYSGPCQCCNVLLINTEYNKNSYTLVGLVGLSPFSEVPVNATSSEIRNYLTRKQYKFSHNINEKVAKLIEKP
jgi:hypothetical protein